MLTWNTMGQNIEPHSLGDLLDELISPGVGIIALQELRGKPRLTSWIHKDCTI